jgi:hypothetical protein
MASAAFGHVTTFNSWDSRPESCRSGTPRASRRFSPSRFRVQCIGDHSPFVDAIRAQRKVDRVAEVLTEDPAQLPCIDPFAEYPLSCTSFPRS